jgi:cell wall-associated NlpC family hydrolase
VRPRRLITFLAAGAVAGVAVTAASAKPPSPAVRAQQQRARAVIAQINRLGANLEQTVQAYDGARIQLAAVEKGLQRNQVALGVARRNLRASQKRLEQRLVSLYEDGSPTVVDVLAGAKTLSQIINRLETAQVLTKQDAALAASTARFSTSVRHREVALRRQQRQRAATVSRLAAQRQTIQGTIGEQQRLLASIHQTIRQIQAREAAHQRLLARLARERIAREEAAQRRAQQLAAQQAAAQRQAQAQAQTQAQTQTPAQTQSSAPPAPLLPSPTPAAPQPAAPGGGHPEAATIATRYLGVPYVWGGASPSGFDCSGLVMYVYAQLGISLPHYTVSQWNATVPVSMSQIEPGDLLFFDHLGHVGIYIGGGQFIHAPHTGTVVQISSLSGYYSSVLDGARRVP